VKVTLSPTGRFQTINQGSGRVECRIWEGVTESGAKVIAHIPMIGLHKSATPAEQEEFGKALREVKAEGELVSFDIRMVI
jgi:hypothetical protein